MESKFHSNWNCITGSKSGFS